MSRRLISTDSPFEKTATLLVVAGLFKPEMKVEIEVTAKLRSP
jgi:hypothetical protein